jgi:hypothetical protein
MNMCMNASIHMDILRYDTTISRVSPNPES